MKRFMTASALTALMTTGAFAATEAETIKIHQYVPGAEVDMLSDVQILQIKSVIYGGDTHSEKRNQIRALIGDDLIDNDPDPAFVLGSGFDTTTDSTISEAELNKIERFAPNDVDLAMLPDSTLEAMLSVVNSSDSVAEKRSTIRGLVY